MIEDHFPSVWNHQVNLFNLFTVLSSTQTSSFGGLDCQVLSFFFSLSGFSKVIRTEQKRCVNKTKNLFCVRNSSSHILTSLFDLYKRGFEERHWGKELVYLCFRGKILEYPCSFYFFSGGGSVNISTWNNYSVVSSSIWI